MNLLRLSGRYLRPHWPLLIGVVLLQLAQSVANLLLPGLNASIIDDGVATGDTGTILVLGALMLAVTIVQIAASIGAIWFGARVAMLLGRDIRAAVFHRVLGFSEQEVSRFGAPSLITRSTNDVQQVQMLVLMTCTFLVSAPILAIGGIIAALQQDAGLSWLLAVAVPLLLIVVGAVVSRMVPLFRRMQVRIDAVNRVLREQLTGIRVVRAFVREADEQNRFAVANAELTQTAVGAGRLFALVFPIVMLLLNVTSVAVIWFGASGIEAGTTQIGALIAFLSYIIQILMAVMMATFMAIMIPRAAVSSDRIQEVLTAESSVRMPDAATSADPAYGHVEFDGVGFRYPGAERDVLADVSFTAEPGRTTAIIGSTGAGKTTVLNLVARLFDTTAGTVRIDGRDVRELTEQQLWGGMGIVPQRPYLFSGTVRSNLQYGNPSASDEELWGALAVAQAEDFVRAMPDGLDAPIAQGGTNVSGGQRQRLAIARALVKRPRIYLFDDSFSALDTATDARLRRALAEAVTEATVIVVAQRVSTIVDADEILVVDDGRIVARGTHDDLLDTSETYREIVSSQLSAQDAA